MEIYLFVLFIILSLADVITTKRIIDTGGVEANPVVKPFVKMLGVLPGLGLLKVLMTLVVYLFCLQNLTLMVIINVAALSAPIWNLYQLRKNGKL